MSSPSTFSPSAFRVGWGTDQYSDFPWSFCTLYGGKFLVWSWVSSAWNVRFAGFANNIIFGMKIYIILSKFMRYDCSYLQFSEKTYGENVKNHRSRVFRDGTDRLRIWWRYRRACSSAQTHQGIHRLFPHCVDIEGWLRMRILRFTGTSVYPWRGWYAGGYIIEKRHMWIRLN